jgi:tetratricopeptide (TPR) repeat protein
MRVFGQFKCVAAVVVCAFFASLCCFCATATPGARDGRQAELTAKIRELEQKKQQLQADQAKSADANRPQGADLEAIITRYEQILRGCEERGKTDRSMAGRCAGGRCADERVTTDRRMDGHCADVMYTLGALYYDQGRDSYAEAQQRYESAGKLGAPPVPDYSKSLDMYWRLSRKYPSFTKLPEAHFQIYTMSVMYLEAGQSDSARAVLEELVMFPTSALVSSAQFRLGEIAFESGDQNKACEHFKKVNKKGLYDEASQKTLLDRLANCGQ